MFNPHGNKTINGVTIVVGLRVLDYDYREGKVLSDDYDREYMCCTAPENHKRDNDMSHDPLMESGNCTPPCNHDHWFTVETEFGTKSFNGSRLKAI